MAGRFDQRPAGLHRIINHAAQIARLFANFEYAARDTAKIEKIFHQTRQEFDLVVDQIAAPLKHRLGRLDGFQDFHGIADRRQWIAQLMRQGREKFILAAIELLQRLLRFIDFGNIRRATDEAYLTAGLVNHQIAMRLEPTPGAVIPAETYSLLEFLLPQESGLECAGERFPIIRMHRSKPVKPLCILIPEREVFSKATIQKYGFPESICHPDHYR